MALSMSVGAFAGLATTNRKTATANRVTKNQTDSKRILRLPVTRALLMACAAFAFYAAGDALIKAGGSGDISVFAVAFFVTIFSVLPVAYTRPAHESWAQMMQMNHPWLTQLRALAGVGAGIFGFYAFTKLPLAEAYTLFFLMPFFVTILSVIFLKERVGWRRWSALMVGMIGVLIVIRPGFREITPAHFAAVGAGLCGAIALVVVRQISTSEKRTSLMGVSIVYALIANGILMLAGFQWPDLSTLAMLASAGVLHGSASLMLMIASQTVPANRIAPLQYSQLMWGVALGVLFFNEWLDAIALMGLTLVALAGLATFIREDARGFWPKNFQNIRNRFG